MDKKEARRALKIGDDAYIRQWDDMVEEYGLNEDGTIPISKGEGRLLSIDFVDEMIGYCGIKVTVVSIGGLARYENEVTLISKDETVDTDELSFWGWSLDMLEPIEGAVLPE